MTVRLFQLLLVFGLANILFGLKKQKYLLKGIGTSAALGCCALFAVRFIGLFFPVSLPLNLFTVTISVFGGIPGVIFLLLGECVFTF
ncbi:MAG: pro-sigmaK processing inhibitor BofA family protein [Clostridia bacterium]|nr:pro-sigmaK processing inhibitor BofA family protein [Clostridia bacterium]